MFPCIQPMNNSVPRTRGIVVPCLFSAALLCSVPAFATIPWTTAIDAATGGQTFPVAIKITPTNEIYIAGQFLSNPSFSGTTLTSRGGFDLFLAKYSSPGHLEWVVQAGGTQDERMQAMDIDSANNVYITGRFTDTATFASANKTTRTVTGYGQTIFLARYSAAGILDWVITGTSPQDGEINFGSGVAVDSATGSLYLGALGQENIVFTSANATTDTVAGVWTWHMVLARFTTDGVFQWGVTNQSSPNSVPSEVTVDKNGDAYLTGSLEDSTTFESRDGNNITVTGFSPAQTTGDYPIDGFLVKYNQQGDVKWVNHFGGYWATGTALAVDLYGQITVVGAVGNVNGSASEMQTIVTSQPGMPNINLGSGTLTDPFNRDEFYATWNAAGQLIRAARTGNGANQESTGIAFSAKGGLNVVGVQQNGSYVSLLWHKYWEQRLLWGKKILNAASWPPDAISPVCAVDNAGNLLIAGPFHGTAKFGTFQLISSGTADMYLAELPPN
jgi:hypothetical protein